MNQMRSAPLAALFALMAACPAHASTIGLPGTTGTTYSTWDTFPAVSYTNDAPDSADNGLFTASLTSAFAGGMLLGGGDRLYAMGNATNFTVNGVANSNLTTLSLVIKFTAPSVGTAPDFYTVALNDVAATSQVFLGSSTEGPNNFQIYQWTWTGLNIATAGTFGITIGSPGDHVSVDAIQLSNFSAVPEPGSLTLLAAGLGGLVLRRSRTRAA